MEEEVRLLDSSTEEGGSPYNNRRLSHASGPGAAAMIFGCGGRRRGRALGMLAVVLLLPSLYLLGPHVNLPHPSGAMHHQHHLHRFGLADLYPSARREPSPELPSGYLVWSSKCRIPDVDPFAEESMALFKKKKYLPCSTRRLTGVSDDEHGHGVLHLNTSAFDKSLGKVDSFTCCYQNVTRPVDPETADSKVIKSKCIKFNSSMPLLDTEEFILTKCEVKYKRGAKRTYEDAHTNVQIPGAVRRRLESTNSTPSTSSSSKPWSVLIIGIDTISRINLARAMPKTNAFFKRNNWLDFQGYNKMDDNTYPNLMAVLTGRNQSRARSTCDRGRSAADSCDFIWKRYEHAGYASAYAEDHHEISTFRKPLHAGFARAPTDHYMQPLFVAVERKLKKRSDQAFCTGLTSSGEQLFDYALQFDKKYRSEKKPRFGFIWANTFSHDDFTSPSTMDERVEAFFEKLNSSGSMEDTIVIFMSDHGTRFGPIRTLLTGFYEERLPALLMWIPMEFRRLHPMAYESISLNTRRLTTPYDLFMTLEDILRLSGRVEGPPGVSEGCPKCQTLFEPVPVDRSCEDASVLSHWCTCDPLERLNTDNHTIGKRALKYLVDVEIEKSFDSVNVPGCRVCAKLKVDKFISLYRYNYLEKKKATYEDYLLVFSTRPGDMIFESTMRHHAETDTFETQGIVSRLSAYEGKGGCVKTAYLKKYCYCTNNKCS